MDGLNQSQARRSLSLEMLNLSGNDFLQRPPSDLKKLFDNLQKVSAVALHEVGELPHDEALAFYRHVPDHLRVFFPEGGSLDLVKLMADLLIEKISTFIAEQDFSFLSNTYIPGLPADITENLLPQLIKHLCEQNTATSYYIAALVLADIIPTEIDMKRCDTDAAAYGQQRSLSAMEGQRPRRIVPGRRG